MIEPTTPWDDLRFALRECGWTILAELMALLRLRELEQVAREQVDEEHTR